MIKKKRLEELIKEEKTIWIQNKYCNAYSYDLTIYNYVGIADNEESLMFLDFSIQEDEPEKILVDYLKYLFETKEEANFASEFQNIQRTETLNLPTWKKFKKDESFQFSDKDGSDWDLYIYSSGIIVLLNGNKTYYFNNSKEGYIEACKTVKKLFLGEKYE